MTRWTRRLSITAFTLLLTVAAGELVVGWMHDFAFPYLNVFEPDERYGVRLTRDTQTRLRSPQGRLSTVVTNRDGFRNPDDFPTGPTLEPGAQRVLVLGDSQVLGYSVEEPETTVAQLRALLGNGKGDNHLVLNAGVPTWGPREYVMAMGELGARLRPDAVVVLFNLANDWFEAPTSNVRRSTARDGWLVHRRGADASDEEVGDGWLRTFVMRDSHLAFFLRALFAGGGRSEAAAQTAGARVAKRLLDNAAGLTKARGRFRTPLAGHLARAKRAADELGATLVVAALPLDLQIDESAFAKYHVPAFDVAKLDLMLDGFAHDARTLGIQAVDLRAPLARAAEQGNAYLPDDDHLSPLGHRAVAAALRVALPSTATPTGPTAGDLHAQLR